MNWYIGQEIVCIKTHSLGLIKEGEIYIINGLANGCCDVKIDVGIQGQYAHYSCHKCSKRNIPKPFSNYVFSETLFAPLMDISELEQILNQKEQTA